MDIFEADDNSTPLTAEEKKWSQTEVDNTAFGTKRGRS